MIQHSYTGRVLPGVNRPASAGRPIAIYSTSLDHQALDGAAKIAVDLAEPRHSEAGAIGADPGLVVEQDPLADRLPCEIDGEIGVEKRPVPEIQHRRGAVAEIRGDHRPH